MRWDERKLRAELTMVNLEVGMTEPGCQNFHKKFMILNLRSSYCH